MGAACSLLGENELVLPRDAQAVRFALMKDDQLALPFAKELATVHAGWPRRPRTPGQRWHRCWHRLRGRTLLIGRPRRHGVVAAGSVTKPILLRPWLADIDITCATFS